MKLVKLRSKPVGVYLLLMLGLFLMTPGFSQDIVINEIMYNDTTATDLMEYLELYNNEAVAIDISGWELIGVKLEFLPGTIMEPGEYLVVTLDTTVFLDRYGPVGHLLQWSAGKLSNAGGETAGIMTSAGDTISSVTYSDVPPWPPEADGEGSSLELINPSLDESDAANWGASVSGGTPGAVNSVFNGAPLITSMPVDTALTDSLYQYQVTASDPEDDPLTYTLTTTAVFLGINSATGLLSGTPVVSDTGSYAVTVTVSDVPGNSSVQSYTLQVLLPPNEPPVITSIPDTTVTVDSLYEYQIVANDPNGDTLSYSLNTIAGFLSLNDTTGLISGTPALDDTGSYLVEVTVDDNHGGSATQNYTLTVSQAPFAKLQVIHNAADPAVQAVDIYINGELFLNDFAFRSATPFTFVPADSLLNIGVAPGSSISAADTVANFPVTLEVGGTYVAIANGVLDPAAFAVNPDGRATGFTLFLKSMARESALGGGVDLFAVHGVSDAPTIDVVARNVQTLLDNFAYGDISDYLNLAAGTYIIDVADSAGSEVIVSFGADLAALEGQSAVLLASGFAEPDSNQGGPQGTLLTVLANGTVMELAELVLEAPRNLTAVGGVNKVDLSWEAPSAEGLLQNLLRFDIYRSEDGENFNVVGNVDSATTSFSDTSLVGGATYYYYVTAVYEEGESDSSNMVSATTLGSAVLPFFEGYNDTLSMSLPAGWIQVDADGGDVDSASGRWLVESGRISGLSPSEGAGLITNSFRAANPEGLIDEWLISPQLQNFQSGMDLSFYAVASGADTPDSLQVLVSVSGINPEDFASLDTLPVSPNGEKHVYELGDFGLSEGDNFYIAFRYHMGGVTDSSHWVGIDEVAVDQLTGIEAGDPIPQAFSLEQNYPNPFNPTTTIRYSLKEDARMTLRIYNVLGQVVRTLVDGRRNAGSHIAQWDGLNDVGVKVASGIYYYKIEANDFVQTRKMILLK